MKHTLRNQILFYLPTVSVGVSCLLLRELIARSCIDERGLLIPGSLPALLLAAAGVLFAAYLLMQLPTLGGSGTYEENFPKSPVFGLLAIAGGVVMMSAVRTMPFSGAWQRWLGYLAAASMMLAGSCRMSGHKAPAAVFHGSVCLFYIVMLMENYRRWNADPQLYHYAYQLVGCVLLMLTSFHRTCCDAGMMQRKPLVAAGLGAVLCCLASLDSGELSRFYLASALWAAGSICRTGTLPPDPKPEPEQPEPEE